MVALLTAARIVNLVLGSTAVVLLGVSIALLYQRMPLKVMYLWEATIGLLGSIVISTAAALNARVQSTSSVFLWGVTLITASLVLMNAAAAALAITGWKERRTRKDLGAMRREMK